MGAYRDVELAELELRSERLLLRRWRPADAPRVHEIMADRSMYDFLALPDPYSLDTARDYVTRCGHEGRDEGIGLGCAVEDRATGRLVGSAALRLGRDPEVGYWIAPDARGHGYAAEAVRALADFAFIRLRAGRLALDCDVRNLGSVRTALAAGFRLEGVSRDAAPAAALGAADLARFGRLAADPNEAIQPGFPMLPGGRLDDGVLTLRMLQPADGPAYHESEDSTAVALGFTGEPHDVAHAQSIADRAGLDWLVGHAARMAMVDSATGSFAGELTVRSEGPPQLGGIGYQVHPHFRGRGYTSRALRLVVPWAFELAGLRRLELGAKAVNIASQRAAANAGFEPDGTRTARLRNPDGSFADEVCFALVNPRYQ